MYIKLFPGRTYENKNGNHLRNESVAAGSLLERDIQKSLASRNLPLKLMHHSNAESGDYTNTHCADNTADCSAQSMAADGREHLTSNDAANDSPADLLDQIQDANEL